MPGSPTGDTARGASRGGGRRRHPRRSGSTRHETDAPIRSLHGRFDPLVLRRQQSNSAECSRSASQLPRWDARTASISASLQPLCVPISRLGLRPWRPRPNHQPLRSDQIAIALVAPAHPHPATSCLGASPTPPVGVSGSSAGSGVRETCTVSDVSSAVKSCSHSIISYVAMALRGG